VVTLTCRPDTPQSAVARRVVCADAATLWLRATAIAPTNHSGRRTVRADLLSFFRYMVITPQG
jgi:hypothetical protein